MGREEISELRPAARHDLIVRGRHPHACFDVRRTGPNGLDLTRNPYEAEKAALEAALRPRHLTLREWSLKHLLPRLELLGLDRRQGRMRAEARDVDPGGIGRFQDRRSIPSLDVEAVYVQGDHGAGFTTNA